MNTLVLQPDWARAALLPVEWPVDLPRVVIPFIGSLRQVDTTLLVIILATAAFTLLTLVTGMIALCVHGWKRYRKRVHRKERAAWTTTLMDVLAGETAPNVLADPVRPRQRGRFLSFLSVYATSVRGNELDRIRAVARPFLPAIRDKVHHRRPAVRAQAVRRLSLFGDGEYLPALREALDDPSETVAWMAMMGLAKRGTADDANLVIRHLDRLSGIDRRQLTSALVELGEDAAPALRRALASPLISEEPQSPFTRLICAEALRWLADAAAAPIAVSLLDQDTDDPELRAALLRLLRRVGRTRHAPAVRAQCQSEVPFVRIHAARALGQLGTADDEDLLASLLHNDEARWVALSAIRSLSELGQTSPIRQLAASAHDRAALAEGFLPRSA